MPGQKGGGGSSHKKKKSSKTPGMKVNEAMKAWKSGGKPPAEVSDASQKKQKVQAKPDVPKAKAAPKPQKDRKPREVDGQLTLKEVLAMGGTKEDFEMLEGLASDADGDSDGEVLEFDDSGKSKVFMVCWQYNSITAYTIRCYA